MATVGDIMKNVWANYIAPTNDANVGNKEKRLVNPNQYGSNSTVKIVINNLTAEKQREVALACPVFMRGIQKKSKDTLREGFRLLYKDSAKSAPKTVQTAVLNFMERSDMLNKFEMAEVCAYIYGDGFILITYADDETTSLDAPPAEGAYPWTLTNLSPEYIQEMVFKPKSKDKILYFKYDNKETGESYLIHPSRIIHRVRDPLPHSNFGNSCVNQLRHILQSKVNVDISTGDLLSWFAHGMYDYTLDDADDDEIKEYLKIFKQHPGYFVHDEHGKLEVRNPEAIDPKPFYDYIFVNIAAAIGMPTHVLKGVEVGRVTGAEAGFTDYCKDVKSIQKEISSSIDKLLEQVVLGDGKVWRYKIDWNPIYVDELAEAEIMNKRVDAASKGSSFLTTEEQREIFNKGQIELDPSVKIEKEKSDSDTSADNVKRGGDGEVGDGA